MELMEHTFKTNTLNGIKQNYIANLPLYKSKHYTSIATRFEPLWNTLEYANNEHYTGWFIKVAIVDINIESGVQESYDTIWFDITGRGDTTYVKCQLGKGDIKFTMAGNLPKVMKGNESNYTRGLKK